MKKSWVLIGLMLASGCGPMATTKVATGGTDAESTIVGPRLTGPSPIATPTPTPRKSGDVTPTPKPTASGARRALSGTQRSALVAALDDMVAAGRASLLAGTMSQTSRLISNNGGSILSDNGLGYRVAQAAQTKISESETTVYVVTYATQTTGIFKSYAKAAYHALPEADREQALIDHFTWTDMAAAVISAGPPPRVDATYNLTLVSSKRLPFTKSQPMKARERYTLEGTATLPVPKMLGWEIEFTMAVVGLNGQTDQATFKGVAGEADLEFVTAADGSRQGYPKRLDLTGANGTGTYAGQMTGATTLATSLEHTATASGTRTRLTVEPRAAGGTRRSIELPAEKLRVVLDVDGDNKGTGELLDLTAATPVRLGGITWNTDGVGTVTLEDGATFQLRVL